MAQKDFNDFKSDVGFLVEQLLISTADAMLKYIESSDIIPVDTHNLKDSTGIGVYQDGILKKFSMPRKANVPRNVNGVAIWGEDMIDQLLDTGISKYGNGDYIVLFSSMPYAEDVDDTGRNAGFFDVLSTEFELILQEVVKRYGV